MPIVIIWFNFLFHTLFSAGYPEPVFDSWIRVERGSHIELNDYIQAYKTESDLGPRDVLEMIQKGELEKAEDNVSPGFSKAYYWMGFSLENAADEKLYLELDNPHIDYVNLYQIILDVPVLISSTGDKREFSTRDVSNRRFVFDLGETEESHFLLMVDKRYAAVSFPLRVWPESRFTASENQANVLFGVYFGILFFFGLFGFVSGFTLKDRLFLSYGVYVLVFSLYMFSQLGFSFEHLYPKSTSLNNYARVVLAIFLVISAVDFFRKFLNVDVYAPKVSKFYSWMGVVLFVVLAAWIVDKQLNPDYAKTTILLLRILYFFIILLILSVIYMSIVTWKRQRAVVLLFLMAFSTLLIGSVFYILIEFGLLPETNFPLNPILLGSIVEIFILSASMVYRVKSINDKKNELSQKIAQQQKELIKAFVTGGEKERSRISAELHDNIGSNLSLLKAKINRHAMMDETINAEIDKLCEDVRNLSHQLMPHEMEITGLQETLKTYCEKFSNDTGIEVDLRFYSFPNLKKQTSFQLYRVVQEALQNIWKHAGATHVEIQLIGYDNEVVVTVDDNGIGFDLNHFVEGNGILNMRTRMEASEGTMELASYPGKGTNVFFRLPVVQTE